MELGQSRREHVSIFLKPRGLSWAGFLQAAAGGAIAFFKKNEFLFF